MIALLQSSREKGRTSLVVAPTSLTYNWLSEIRRFAPDLSTVILNGTAQQRSGMIRHIAEYGDIDVAITSYPLIRRDIDQLKEIRFRFLILDDALYHFGASFKDLGKRLFAFELMGIDKSIILNQL